MDVSAPEAEMAGYRVLDYKTGTSAPRCSEIEGGTDFQLPFYAMAAAQVLPDERVKRARCLQWAYYRVRRPPELASRPKSEDRLDELVELATKWALQHAENIRAGMFPVEPRGGCTYCDFACVCRHDPYRVG
ncbi:MAG: PD-(D/E)XK nuclease family protein, partial [Armatimonadota bacterium]